MIKAIKTEKAPARSKLKTSKANGWVLGRKFTFCTKSFADVIVSKESEPHTYENNYRCQIHTETLIIYYKE